MPNLHTLIAKATGIVSRWRGRSAKMLELTRSHATLSIILFGDERDSNLVIYCIGPEHISGPITWDDSEIVIEAAQLQSGREGIALIDKKHGVRLTADSFEVKENVRQ